jgi:N-methylhydantoinase A
MYRVAIDTGGTFTDYIAIDQDGRTVMVKNPTDRQNPALGILAGLQQLARNFGLDLSEFLDGTAQIVHGTTLALNALLEKQGARTALLATEGFRDALEIRRSRRADQWDLRAPIAPVLVPRRLRLGVAERLNYRGEEVAPLDRRQLQSIIAKLKQSEVESVAICFLFSFLNPVHEQEVAEILTRELPGVFVTASSEIAPRIGEYERVSTTVLNAYLTPVLVDYLSGLERELQQYGWRRPVHIMMNNGGLTDTSAIKRTAVKTLLSGPAGGARGGQDLARVLGRSNLVVADMGGTSFDVTLVSEAESRLVPGAEIGGYPVSLPVIDIHSIGAGGGSIASVDGSGRLLVGPRSAGSYPGPACYGRGGTEPTVTDAALVLGLLNRTAFLGGRLELDCRRAEDAVRDNLAARLGLNVEEAALAVYQVATAKMADAVRLVTVQQGHDPRHLPLVAAGGAFPLFAGLIARELEMPEVIIPVQGPVFCAWGMLGSTCRHEVVRSCPMPQTNWDAGRLAAILDQMQDLGRSELERLGVLPEKMAMELTLEMKYTDQHHEIGVLLKQIELDKPGLINEAFHQRHQELYGYAEWDKNWEIVTLRLTCQEKPQEVVMPGWNRIGAAGAGKGAVRQALLDSRAVVSVPVYDIQSLPDLVAGPALIDFPYTTVLVPDGFTAALDERGFISLRQEVV